MTFCVKLLIFSLIAGAIYIETPRGMGFDKKIEEFEKYEVEGMSDIEMIEQNEEAKELLIEIIADSGPVMIISTIMMSSIIVLIGTPIYRLTR